MKTNIFLPEKTLVFAAAMLNWRRFEQFSQQCQERTVVIDLKHVEKCDSAGLAFLIEAKKCCYQQQKRCHVINIPSEMLSLVQFCHLEAVILESKGVEIC